MFLQPLSDPRATLVRLSDLVDQVNRKQLELDAAILRRDCFLAAIQFKNKEAKCLDLGEDVPGRERLPQTVKDALGRIESKPAH